MSKMFRSARRVRLHNRRVTLAVWDTECLLKFTRLDPATPKRAGRVVTRVVLSHEAASALTLLLTHAMERGELADLGVATAC